MVSRKIANIEKKVFYKKYSSKNSSNQLESYLENSRNQFHEILFGFFIQNPFYVHFLLFVINQKWSLIMISIKWTCHSVECWKFSYILPKSYVKPISVDLEKHSQKSATMTNDFLHQKQFHVKILKWQKNS